MAAMEVEDVHNIFVKDPLQFKSLVNKVVEVETVNGTSEIKGILFTVDPVSET